MDNLRSFIDARQIETGTEIETDICIIGGGAAGITIALQFAGTNVKVTILETGGLNHEAEIHELGAIRNIGRPYDTEACRLRYFGGTTNHWGGHCVRLEEIDFRVRDWIPESGWPFGLDHLLPYYDRAHEIIGVGHNQYDPEPIAASLGYNCLPFAKGKIVSTLSRYSRRRFGIHYSDTLGSAPNVTTFLYATVMSVTLCDEYAIASHALVKTLSNNEFKVKAKRFVLATGGIENARLLLDSDHQQKTGLGNSSGYVGRYFQDHISYASGVIVPKTPVDKYDMYFSEKRYFDVDHLKVRASIAISQDATQELRIPKFRAELLLASSFVRSMQNIRHLHFSSDDVYNLLQHHSWLWDFIAHRQRPNQRDEIVLMNYVEQTPNTESRVTLSEETNALGQRIAQLDWRLLSLDKEGIKVAHNIIAHEVGRSDFGRFRYEMPDDEGERILDGARSGFHHMGTTRMHNDPKKGIVDQNCRMHDVRNLFVAGSSVFPCSGWPNPTLTIVAMAVRLADYLKMEIARNG
jgi:choline dehydrogenase-like flavoprotein